MPNTVELDTTIALIDEEEYFRHVGVEVDNDNVDQSRVIEFINWASTEIKKLCDDRIFITPQNQIEETFIGDGTCEYFTKNGRIADTSTASVVLSYWVGDSYQVCTYGREFEVERGLVFFHNGYTFTDGVRWKIVYKPGWPLASVPQDLKAACVSLVQRRMKLVGDGTSGGGGKEGISTESMGDSTTTYNLTNLIGESQLATIRKYKRRFL